MNLGINGAPFLSSDYFISISNVFIYNIISDVYLRDIKNQILSIDGIVIIFIKSEILYHYIYFLLELNIEYKLITSTNVDCTIPYLNYPTNNEYYLSSTKKLLENEYLLKWYAKNICIDHPKLEPIPIGPKFQWVSTDFFGEDKTNIMKIYNNHFLTPYELFKNQLLKSNLLYLNFSTNTTNYTYYSEHQNLREKIKMLFENNNEFQFSEHKECENYIEELKTYKFCLAPPGAGIDTHRTWEALYAGTIPIVLCSPLNKLYEDLPVLIVDDYSIINKEYLTVKYEEIIKKEYNFEKLYSNYWYNKIKNYDSYIDKKYEPYWSNYLKQYDLNENSFKNIQLNTTKFCVIVETRTTNTLLLVIKNFMYLLQNKNWGLIIFHGKNNEKFLKNNLGNIPNIIFINLNIQKLSVFDYSLLLLNIKFWETLKTYNCKNALIFQIDTLLMNDNVDDFINYDYIGAPWHTNHYNLKLEVGNGGLSLRNVNSMIEILTTCPILSLETGEFLPEDIYFSYWCKNKKYNIPTLENATLFSFETIFCDKSCGFHKPYIENFDKKEDFFNILKNNIHVYFMNEKDATAKLILYHNNLKLDFGTFNDEFPEQIMATMYLKGHEKVLEIGSNIGRNSLIICSILNNDSNLVTLESDINIANQLKHNRNINNFNFHIENSALSKRKLIQKGWDTIESDALESDTLLEGYTKVKSITWEELNEKYKIDFDTLVLDCEGAFYYILLDMPEILENIKLIIMENDYYDYSHKIYIDEQLRKNNFYRSYSKIGGWGHFYNNFFEVWVKK